MLAESEGFMRWLHPAAGEREVRGLCGCRVVTLAVSPSLDADLTGDHYCPWGEDNWKHMWKLNTVPSPLQRMGANHWGFPAC